MDLKDQKGFSLIKTEELQKLEKIALYIKEKRVIASISSAWRKIDTLEKMLKEVFDVQETDKR